KANREHHHPRPVLHRRTATPRPDYRRRTQFGGGCAAGADTSGKRRRDHAPARAKQLWRQYRERGGRIEAPAIGQASREKHGTFSPGNRESPLALREREKARAEARLTMSPLRARSYPWMMEA